MLNLRPYQRKLVSRVRASLVDGHKHVLVQSPAGSGKTVIMAAIAKGATDKGNSILFVVHRRELVEQTKRTFKAMGVNMSICRIGMVQTITRRLDKLEPPKVILVDEAHHSLAKSYKRIFEKFSQADILGFTATPTRMGKVGLHEVYDDLIIGPRIDWLINNHYLAPYKYYSVKLIDTQSLKRTSTGDFSAKSIEKASQRIIYGDVIRNYQKYANGTKTIIYTYSVDSSKKIADAFKKQGYPALQVDGTTSKLIRQQAMDEFRAGTVKVLVNADLYGEGVDVPDCETVIMLRPTESLSLFIQQAMRCMRYVPNKTATIIDHVANYTRHGLPDTQRQWTLDDRKKGKQSKPLEVPVITCPKCFAVIPASYRICPLCGAQIETERAAPQVDKTAKLKEITKDDFKLKFNHYAVMKPSEANSFSDLTKIAKAKGYKPGWAFYQAKSKGLIRR